MKRKVAGVIYRENKYIEFLVLKRTPERLGFWQCLSGNVDGVEEIEQAIKREVREETGNLEIVSISKPIHSFEFNDGNDDFKEYVFVIKIKHDSVVNIDPKEHDTYEWLDYNQARNKVKWDKQKLDLALSFINEAHNLQE